jgi:hypothetical protein
MCLSHLLLALPPCVPELTQSLLLPPLLPLLLLLLLRTCGYSQRHSTCRKYVIGFWPRI